MIKKKILFATDFSDRDNEAMQIACRLAAAWQAKLLIVHVNDAGDTGPIDSVSLTPATRLKQFEPQCIDVDFEHILLHGDPATELLQLEHNRNVALVILGTHGRGGLRRAFLGSVAEKVMRGADCPVMTLRQIERKLPVHDQLTRILLPVDFSVYGYAA